MPNHQTTIRRLADNDVPAVAEIHALSFARQSLSREWIACNQRAFPRMQSFVAEHEGRVGGYILWLQKSGFREEAVLELEQIAVHPQLRGRGIGEALVRESLPGVAAQLAERGARLKIVLVTTRRDNAAQQLYERVLGARVEAVMSALYSADEVIMVARGMDLWLDSHRESSADADR